MQWHQICPYSSMIQRVTQPRFGKASYFKMLQRCKHISLFFVALSYLIATSGSLTIRLSMPAPPSSGIEIKNVPCETGEPRKPILTNRRYVPLVKELSTTSVHITSPPNRNDTNKQVMIDSSDLFVLLRAFYFSSLSDRAPPLC